MQRSAPGAARAFGRGARDAGSRTLRTTSPGIVASTTTDTPRPSIQLTAAAFLSVQ